MISDKSGILTTCFDCIVMLTWSDWKKEPRSNRYHYASRFAKYLPVLFVQPDLKDAEATIEITEIENIKILHVYSNYGLKQNKLINRAIINNGYIRPLLWTYNSYFSSFVAQHFSPLSIYHATEDYFSPDFPADDYFLNHMARTLEQTDLLIAVSEEVLSSYINKGKYTGRTLLLPNGCDYKFWAPSATELQQIGSESLGKKIALYQGGLNRRLDWSLIDSIGKSLPDWEIWLCGVLAAECQKALKSLRSPNIKKLGYLNPENLRQVTYKATVGIIPFKQIDMIHISLPLKAFEYAACGLPVVSVPIKALTSKKECFRFATTPEEFVNAIIEVAPTRYDTKAIEARLIAAAEQDYDTRFEELVQEIHLIMSNKRSASRPPNLLILYDANSVHVNTINEHLKSFSTFSQSQVVYAPATHKAKCPADLEHFDVIVVHYSVRLSLDWHLSPSFADAIREFGGYKILFIQDEYDTTETARQWITSLGINAIFTCVPDEYVDLVYPSSRFPYLERIPTLTGYVPLNGGGEYKSVSERKNVIGYRGRPLPYHYGDLGREKMIIAERMRDICEQRGIPVDIDFTNEKRIYGDQWYAFIKDCKATLGTESGSNVFDDFGNIKKNIELALNKNPSISYEEIHTKYIGTEEGRIKMNQISPRLFEAIAFRTALVLFEGTYSGILKPEEHFIPLKKDFSNVDDVLARLQDDLYLEAITERAYKDIIDS
jgi:glycosyltransferase involved in cell wall biosynthesis